MRRDYHAGLLDIAEVTQRVQGWVAHVEHGDTWGLRASLLTHEVFVPPGVVPEFRQMTDLKESPVFVKMFDLVVWVVPLTVKFPREQRFVVASALQQATFAAHEALVRAGQSAAPGDTLDHLREVATQLAMIRFHLRLSERFSLITVRQYELASEQLGEIGRLVRAWQNTCYARLHQSQGQ